MRGNRIPGPLEGRISTYLVQLCHQLPLSVTRGFNARPDHQACAPLHWQAACMGPPPRLLYFVPGRPVRPAPTFIIEHSRGILARSTLGTQRGPLDSGLNTRMVSYSRSLPVGPGTPRAAVPGRAGCPPWSHRHWHWHGGATPGRAGHAVTVARGRAVTAAAGPGPFKLGFDVFPFCVWVSS